MKTSTQLKAKARNLSEKTGIPPHIIQRNFFLERFLERVSIVPLDRRYFCRGWDVVAVYVCGKCKFCFERTGEVSACEDCGHVNIRLANEEEIAEFERNKAEFRSYERGARDA